VATIANGDAQLTLISSYYMRKKQDSRHRPPPWWNDTLNRELGILGRWKVKLRNANNALERRALRAKFKRLKATHKKHCFRARRDVVTETGNSEPWGGGGPVFKWLKTGGSRPSENLPTAVRKENDTFTTSLGETGKRLMDTLVPSDSYENESPEQIAARIETGVMVGSFSKWSDDPGQIEPCDVAEVKRAIWRKAHKKSPGMDSITTEYMKSEWSEWSKRFEVQRPLDGESEQHEGLVWPTVRNRKTSWGLRPGAPLQIYKSQKKVIQM